MVFMLHFPFLWTCSLLKPFINNIELNWYSNSLTWIFTWAVLVKSGWWCYCEVMDVKKTGFFSIMFWLCETWIVITGNFVIFSSNHHLGFITLLFRMFPFFMESKPHFYFSILFVRCAMISFWYVTMLQSA